jgi:hypothetical protein
VNKRMLEWGWAHVAAEGAYVAMGVGV